MNKYISFFFMIVLVVQLGCKEEAIDYSSENIVYSSGMIIPGELFCMEDVCYWIDPELWEEPMDPSQPIPGEANMKGRIREIFLDEGGKVTDIYCWGTGTVCGKLYWELADGTLIETGLYLKTN